ncbi:MAG: GNAT family N-acetyltransferase [Bacteroidetes bacterium]|nr:MAG: GNAT family N-acetyltransferase [Bacteroidota bacterium]REJ99923.1 MAG: GNAT family N-acetyltransferase [Bacteroidota bacterium]REK35897.1 MAG: GNAT family N-acetyltransferase [Bacteroidota bacterium]REK50626.1 MAG: GNAT family N-acetyltransferase [Bacteroidota bacterium]
MKSQGFRKIDFQEELREYFYSINIEWLKEYFDPTAEDLRILKNPEEIISMGGRIVFISAGKEPIGTCALIPADEDKVRLIKMGVKKDWRGRGAGKFLLQSAIEEAKTMGAGKIVLETSEKLQAAKAVYSSAGFRQTGIEIIHPEFGRKVFEMQLELDK